MVGKILTKSIVQNLLILLLATIFVLKAILPVLVSEDKKIILGETTNKISIEETNFNNMTNKTQNNGLPTSLFILMQQNPTLSSLVISIIALIVIAYYMRSSLKKFIKKHL